MDHTSLVSHQDWLHGRAPNALSALEITLLPSHRGQPRPDINRSTSVHSDT